MTEEPRPTSLFESARAIWQRRKGMAILAIVLPVAVVVGLTAFLPNVYQSTALVLVERQQVPEAYVKSAVTSEVESRLQTISQDVLSRVRLEALIERFGLYPELRTGQERLTRMRKDIELELKSIERKGQSDGITSAFTISYRGRDPRQVADVTNALASFYVEQNIQLRERLAQGTSGFLKGQLDSTKARLDQLERQVGEFKKRYIGELPEQLPANLATLEQLHAQLRLNSINQTRTSERRAGRVETEDAAGPLTEDAGPEKVAARLTRLRGELAQLRTQYSDRYPDVRGLKAEIGSLEERLAAEPKTTASAPRRKRGEGEIDAELNALRAEDKRLRDAIGVYQRRVENTPIHEQAFRVLARDYDTTREHYASLVKRYEEAQLAENLEVVKKGEQFRIVETALPAEDPVAPNRLRLALVGLGFAVGMAGLAVVLAEQSDTSFHSAADVRAFTAVPVLAGIPLIVRAGDRRARRRRRSWVVAGALAATAVVVLVTYLVADGNVSLVWLLTRGKA